MSMAKDDLSGVEGGVISSPNILVDFLRQFDRVLSEQVKLLQNNLLPVSGRHMSKH
jgi:hypothetical protein